MKVFNGVFRFLFVPFFFAFLARGFRQARPEAVERGRGLLSFLGKMEAVAVRQVVVIRSRERVCVSVFCRSHDEGAPKKKPQNPKKNKKNKGAWQGGVARRRWEVRQVAMENQSARSCGVGLAAPCDNRRRRRRRPRRHFSTLVSDGSRRRQAALIRPPTLA